MLVSVACEAAVVGSLPIFFDRSSVGVLLIAPRWWGTTGAEVLSVGVSLMAGDGNVRDNGGGLGVIKWLAQFVVYSSRAPLASFNGPVPALPPLISFAF